MLTRRSTGSFCQIPVYNTIIHIRRALNADKNLSQWSYSDTVQFLVQKIHSPYKFCLENQIYYYKKKTINSFFFFVYSYIIHITRLTQNIFYIFLLVYLYLSLSIARSSPIRICDAVSDTDIGINEHGIAHRRGLTCPAVHPIPDLRSGLDSPAQSPLNRQPFQGALLKCCLFYFLSFSVDQNYINKCSFHRYIIKITLNFDYVEILLLSFMCL